MAEMTRRRCTCPEEPISKRVELSFQIDGRQLPLTVKLHVLLLPLFGGQTEIKHEHGALDLREEKSPRRLRLP